MKKLTYILLLCPIILLSQIQIGQNLLADRLGEDFGYSIALSSDGLTMAIGNRNSNPNTVAVGEVEVFSLINNQWVQKGSSLFGVYSEAFGASVKLSDDGETLIVGSPASSGGGVNSGGVTVYTFNGTDWIQKGQKLYGAAQSALFGFSVDINSNGNRIAASSPNISNDTGLVYVFDFDSASNTWNLIGSEISGNTSTVFFGLDIDLSDNGTTIAIGTPRDNSAFTNAGMVKVFEFQNNQWVQKGTDILGNAQEVRLGASVSITNDGNRIAVGIPFDSESTFRAGKVTFYDFTNQNWTQVGNAIQGNTSEQFFGNSVELSANGNVATVLSPSANNVDDRSVSIYQFDGNNYVQRGITIPIDGLRGALAISDSGNILALGNYLRTNNFGLAQAYDISSVLSLPDNSLINVLVYPNPTSKIINVSIEDETFLKDILIYDVLGHLILRSKNQTIDVSDFKSGLYLLKLRTKDNKEMTTKIVVR
ncbi:T9SS type A sorting domain-containing protein [Winogradskyella luteola]|uniref:T9SS type A sorting domain-containing protein n=1 Tax=Winogradskyella luteola TaxID=2828330 RepID=A0A9X1JRW3_9FLAO|nr:T9SS type A sorting domain-containing protein [Winogradskyella luteola]MBV7270323.1 T9SS type A sorting domain-containing protein [Winogradskyella luteola]